MSMKKLTSRQIFGMKRESVEKRVEAYFEETKDATTVIQYVFALLLRNALSVTDFSGVLSAVVQQIFLHSKPNDILRSLAPFFKSYFSGGEWEKVVTRLFNSKKNYHSYNETISLYKKYLLEETTPIDELDDQQYKFVSAFLKGDGGTHAWSLRDADPKISEEKFQAMLALLSMLTVFEKDGVRLFVKAVNSDLTNCTRRSLIKKKKASKKEADEEELESVEEKETPIGATLADLLHPETNEDQQEMKIALPAGVKMEDLSKEELLEIVNAQLPEGAVLTDLRLAQGEGSEQEDVSLFDDALNQQEPVSTPVMSAVKEPPKQVKKKSASSSVKEKSDVHKSKNKRKPEKDAVDEYFSKKNKKSKRKRGRRK